MPAARTQQALAYELQWTMPPGASDTGAGSNSLGAFVAEFSRGRDGGDAFVTRKILHYTRLWSRIGLPPGGDDAPTSSQRKITFDGGPWFAALAGARVQPAARRRGGHHPHPGRRATTPAGAFEGAPTDPARYIWEDLLPRPIRPTARGPRCRSASRSASVSARPRSTAPCGTSTS